MLVEVPPSSKLLAGRKWPVPPSFRAKDFDNARHDCPCRTDSPCSEILAGRVASVLPRRATIFVTTPLDALELSFEGIAGDFHAGRATRRSGAGASRGIRAAPRCAMSGSFLDRRGG